MNTKGIKRKLNLNSHISMSSNKAKLDDTWSEFWDNNSPIHNEALSPLFYTLEEHSDNIAYDKYGNEYSIENGSGSTKVIKKNHQNILSVTGEKFYKREFDSSNLMEYWNGHFYEALPMDDRGFITILKDKEFYKEVDIGNNFTIYSMRLFKGELFCLSRYQDTWYFDGWGKYVDVSSSIWQGLSGAGIKDVALRDPKIQVNGSLATICNITGSIVRADELMTLSFYFDGNNITVKALKDLPVNGTVDIPGATYTRSTRVLISITQDKYTEQKVCYLKDDGKYYDEDDNLLTFSKGYVPTFVSGREYKYWEYHTIYSYSFDQSGGTYDGPNGYTDAGDITASFNVKLVNPLYEVGTTEWNFSITQEAPYTSVSSNQIHLVNNFGYIETPSLYSPDVLITVYEDTFKVGTFNKVFTHNTNKTTSSSTGYTKFFTHYMVLDDYGDTEYVYGWRSIPNSELFANEDKSTFRGYHFKNKVLNHTNFTLEPIVKLNDASGSYASVGCCYTIQYGFYRYASVSVRGNWEYFANAGLTSTEVYDSLIDDAFANQGVRRGTKWVDVTINKKTIACYDFMVAEGSRKQKQETFSPLFNYGQPYGFSYNGILVCPWETVDDSVPWYADDNCCFYKDFDTKKWVFIEKVPGTEFQMVEDRYLVLNTTSYWNCWDTLLNRKEHYASDWNNRILHHTNGYTSNRDWVFATAHNTYPANSGSGITSSYFPPIVAEGGNSSKILIGLPEDCESIELYEASGLTKSEVEKGETLTGNMIPKYYMTVTSGAYLEKDTVKKIDSNLIFNKAVKATYPLTDVEIWQRNPSIFAKWTYSGNNIDYFTDGRYGYQITYNQRTTMNTTPTLLSNLTGDVYNLTTVFVIQSMPYAVIDGKLYSLNYLDGRYQGMDCVLNIKGMQYVGAVPSIAFFYSPMNRCLYSFTGDCNLTKVRDAGAISEVYNTWYNSATQTIYMATDDGLYLISDISSIRQEFFNVQNVYFLEDGSSVVVDYEDETYKAYHIYYDWEEGRITNKVRLDTGLYGAGENKVFTIDKWSIELHSNDHLNGELKVKSFILTDKGTIESEENVYKVKKTDWDEEFDNLLINYTPAKNKGVGVGLKLLSDFAINDITASATVGIETQPARVSI